MLLQLNAVDFQLLKCGHIEPTLLLAFSVAGSGGLGCIGSYTELRVRKRPRGAGGSPERKRRGKRPTRGECPKRATTRGEELLKESGNCPYRLQLKQGCVFSCKGKLLIGFWVASLMSFVLWDLFARKHVSRVRLSINSYLFPSLDYSSVTLENAIEKCFFVA